MTFTVTRLCERYGQVVNSQTGGVLIPKLRYEQAVYITRTLNANVAVRSNSLRSGG